MAAIPLKLEISAAIVADWRTGAFSQQGLADKHKVSKGAVNKLCKGVAQDTASIVTAGVAYQVGLAGQDDRNVTAVTELVNEQTKHLDWLNKAALKNASEAMKLQCNDQLDHVRRSDTILKTKETLVGKTPETAIQINNTQSPALSLPEYKQALREALDAI